MDELHLSGVRMIQWTQEMFKGYEELMLILSHLGDPRNAFLLYFPLTYFFHRSSGVKVMWTGAIAEWLNAIFKWLLFGERPYWWVHTTKLYTDSAPHINQYRLTCETGPGSPSGHAMVTAAVLYIMVRCLQKYKLNQYSQRRTYSTFSWLVYGVIMLLVCLSRCYISAHFPHQVIAGVIVGAVLGECIMRYDVDNVTLVTYVVASVTFLVTTPALYYLLTMVGYNPAWSVELATEWCARPEWVYLDTSPFFAITRDASVLLGCGVGLWIMEKYPIYSQEGDTSRDVIYIVVSILLTRGMEYVRFPQDNRTLFYTLGFFKYFMLFVVVVALIQRLCNIFFPSSHMVRKDR